MPTFSVCAIVREEAAVLDRFVRFYLQAGAETVFLYLDGPDPGFTNPDPARVRVRSVEDTFLAKTGEPLQTRDLSEKQRTIYGICFRELTSDWMLYIDADEFLVGPDSISAMLTQVPARFEAVRIRNAEAVWGPGDDLDEMFGCSYFRLPMHGWRTSFASVLYRDNAVLFQKGLLGHSAGKALVRRGIPADVYGAHGPKRDGKNLGVWAHHIDAALADYMVAHYDAVSFTRWREKVRIRTDGTITAVLMRGPREEQMHRSGQALAQGEGASRALFVKLYGLTRLQTLILKGLGRLARMRPFERVDT